jgi:tRNA threonylcarbamoyladenosine biosynthesis protein TsaB
MSDTAGWSQAILTIDTSSPQGSIALYDGLHLSTRPWPAGRSHTTTLLSEIHHLLDAAEVEIATLAAIGVAIGPGTFTGLRVGLGVAKGFHLATGIPLIAVSTLEATALPFTGCDITVVPVVAAGRSRLTWARYEPVDNGIQTTEPPRNSTVAELVESLAGNSPAIVTGELTDDEVEIVKSKPNAIVPALPLRLRHPGAFADITWRRLNIGDFDDATSIEPIYLSRPAGNQLP